MAILWVLYHNNLTVFTISGRTKVTSFAVVILWMSQFCPKINIKAFRKTFPYFCWGYEIFWEPFWGRRYHFGGNFFKYTPPICIFFITAPKVKVKFSIGLELIKKILMTGLECPCIQQCEKIFIQTDICHFLQQD